MELSNDRVGPGTRPGVFLDYRPRIQYRSINQTSESNSRVQAFQNVDLISTSI